MLRLSSFVAICAAVARCTGAVDVGSCAEFAAVDREVETEVTITNADITCDEYTRLSIRTDMVLKSSVGKVTFSNLSLKVWESLTVEPDVVFTGVTLAVSEKEGESHFFAPASIRLHVRLCATKCIFAAVNLFFRLLFRPFAVPKVGAKQNSIDRSSQNPGQRAPAMFVPSRLTQTRNEL